MDEMPLDTAEVDAEIARHARIYRGMTMEKAIGMADVLRDGGEHPVKGVIECAVGCIKRCKRGHVEHVVHYNDIMAHKRNVSSTCRICDPDDDMPECLDTEENRMLTRSFRLIDRILRASPPKNDGILELDRIAYIYHMMSVSEDISIDDARADVFDPFMLECARRGVLTDDA